MRKILIYLSLFSACSGGETSPCMEKAYLIGPQTLRYISCEYPYQTVEVVDKPMPGAQYAYWVLKCVCPRPYVK